MNIKFNNSKDKAPPKNEKNIIGIWKWSDYIELGHAFWSEEHKFWIIIGYANEKTDPIAWIYEDEIYKQLK